MYIDLLGWLGGEGKDARRAFQIGRAFVSEEFVNVSVFEMSGLHDSVGSGKRCHADGVAVDVVIVVAEENVELHEVDVCHCAIAMLKFEVESLAAWIPAFQPCGSVVEMLGVNFVVPDDFCAQFVR